MNIILLFISIVTICKGKYTRFSREVVGTSARLLALVLLIPFLLQISVGIGFARSRTLKSDDDVLQLFKVLAIIELVSVFVCIGAFFLIFLKIAHPKVQIRSVSKSSPQIGSEK